MNLSIYLSILLSSSFFSCASTALDSVFSEPDIITHDAVSERSADDLALALSEFPEYTEIFDLFVSLLVMMQEQKPLKTILRMAQQLRNQIFFVQKYASDPLLDEILAWCQAQKGLGKKKMAAWKKVVIAAAATVSVLGIVAYILGKRAQYKQKLAFDEAVVALSDGAQSMASLSSGNQPTGAPLPFHIHAAPHALGVLAGAGHGVVGRPPTIFQWSSVDIVRKDSLGGFEPSQLPSLVLNTEHFGVTIDAPQYSTPFFKEWKEKTGCVVRGDISSFSYCPNGSIPFVLKKFLQSAQLRPTIRRVVEKVPARIKGVGLFLSQGRYYCSLCIGRSYFLWRVGERFFIPINLREARQEGRLEGETITSSMTLEESKTAVQRYRNRRCVYENPAIVVFYTTQADLIQFMVTSGDEDSCSLVV